MTSLHVSEVFGPTAQGEGPHTGRRCAFIRLGLCNLDCSWCDTPYTWDWERFDREAELVNESAEHLTSQVVGMGVRLVVITGGEPLVQRGALMTLVGCLQAQGMEVEVETNGTIEPSAELLAAVEHWNCSPKLANSGVALARRLRPDVLRRLNTDARSVAFKFVCCDPADLAEVAAMCASAGIPPERVWIMPEGRGQATIAGRWRAGLAEATIEAGYNLSGRLQVQIWGDERGH